MDDVAERTWVMGLLAISAMGGGPVAMPIWIRLVKKYVVGGVGGWVAISQHPRAGSTHSHSFSRRFGKYKIWIAYSFWNSLTCPFFILCGHNKMAAYLVAFLNGTAVGGQFIVESTNNDLMTYDEML